MGKKSKAQGKNKSKSKKKKQKRKQQKKYFNGADNQNDNNNENENEESNNLSHSQNRSTDPSTDQSKNQSSKQLNQFGATQVDQNSPDGQSEHIPTYSSQKHTPKDLRGMHVEDGRTLEEIMYAANDYTQGGQYSEAEKLNDQMITFARKHTNVPEDSFLLACLLNDTARVSLSLGKLDKGIQAANEAYKIAKRIRDKSLMAVSLSHSGRLYHNQGDEQRSEQFHREAISMYRELYGDRSGELGAPLTDLGVTLTAQGRLEEAEQVIRLALDVVRQGAIEVKDPDKKEEYELNAATCLGAIADTLTPQFRYNEAEKLYREALVIKRKLRGTRHPDLITSFSDLSDLLARKGNYEEAEKMERAALYFRRSLLGPEHPDVAGSLASLGEVLSIRGKVEEADKVHKEGIEHRRRTVGEESAFMGFSLQLMARHVARHKSKEEAVKMQQENVALRRRIHGENHPCLIDSLQPLSDNLLRLDRLEESEQAAREALAVSNQCYGENHLHASEILTVIASVYLKQDKFVEAAPMLRKAIRIAKENYGTTSSSVTRLPRKLRLLNIALQLGFDDRQAEIDEVNAELRALEKQRIGDEGEDFGDDYTDHADDDEDDEDDTRLSDGVLEACSHHYVVDDEEDEAEGDEDEAEDQYEDEDEDHTASQEHETSYGENKEKPNQVKEQELLLAL